MFKRKKKQSPITFNSRESYPQMTPIVNSISIPLEAQLTPQLREESSKPLSFEEAFRQARALYLQGGPNTFMWLGKKYTTDLASDTKPKLTTKKTLKPQVQTETKPENKDYRPTKFTTDSSVINTILKDPSQTGKQKAIESQKIIQYADWVMKDHPLLKSIPITYKAAVNSYIAELRKRASLKPVDSSAHPRNIAIRYGEKHS